MNKKPSEMTHSEYMEYIKAQKLRDEVHDTAYRVLDALQGVRDRAESKMSRLSESVITADNDNSFLRYISLLQAQDPIKAKRFREALSGGSAIPKVWDSKIRQLQKEKSVFADHVENYDDARRIGNAVYFPIMGPVTVGELSPGVAPSDVSPTIDNEAVTFVERGALVYINRSAKEDAIPSLQRTVESRLSSAMALDWDSQILSWLEAPAKAIGGTVTETGTMQGTIIAKALGSLTAGTVPAENALLVVHSLQFESLMKDTMFVDNFKGGRYADLIDVRVSPLIDNDGGTCKAYLVGDRCVGISDKGLRIEEDSDISTRRTALMCWQRYAGTIVEHPGVVEIKTVES